MLQDFVCVCVLFLLSGTSKPGTSLELERGVRESEGAGACMTFNPNINLSITQQRQRLPIFQVLYKYAHTTSRKTIAISTHVRLGLVWIIGSKIVMILNDNHKFNSIWLHVLYFYFYMHVHVHVQSHVSYMYMMIFCTCSTVITSSIWLRSTGQ